MPKFHMQTFGCQMNVNDSDWLARSLVLRGFEPSSFDEADFYIINTCSVRDKPEQKVYSELGRIARFCKLHGREGVTVCVGGCVAQQVGEKLTRRFPQVRLLFGADGISKAPEALVRLADDPHLRLSLLEFVENFEERPISWEGSIAPASAFVNIMQGCDNFCTYCIVPYVRGRQKSRRPEEILQECQNLLLAGTKEITLLGQNVNSYGQDALGTGMTFLELLEKVAALPGLARLRFVTPHPKDMDEGVIKAFGSLPNLCPRVHLPLQSGSDAILKKMGRRYTSGHFLDLVEKLKAVRPDILLATDIIVGFPGESDADFQATMDMMQACSFAASFSFIYSDRPHAKASLLGGKVPRPLALERLAVLQAWQEEQVQVVLESWVGKTVQVLLETKRGESAFAANSSQATTQVSQEGTEKTECWHCKTVHGLTVDVVLPVGGSHGAGTILEAKVEGKSRHALKGVKAG